MAANNEASVSTPERGQWKSRFGFVLASAGSAIGLGNIWKFPFITGENGGGLFVLIYLACITLVGLPIMLGEVIIGRAAQRSPVPAFEALTGGKIIWSLIGWMGVVTGFILLSYYSIVAGWATGYIKLAVEQAFSGLSHEAVAGIFADFSGDFQRSVIWHAIFMALTIGIVFGGIQRGIEAASRFLMPALFLILGALLVFSFTLSGFSEAAAFLFAPKALKHGAGSILEALGHSFFTLSLGIGALITYGSYLDRDDDIVVAGASIATLDTVSSLMACLIMFPILFTVGAGPEQGPGLVFIAMPTALSEIPGGALLSIVFFVLLFFAALASAISLLEVVVATFIDKFGFERGPATVVVGLVIFLMGIPSAKSDLQFSDIPGFSSLISWIPPGLIAWIPSQENFFLSLDWAVSNVLLPIGGFLISIFVGWIMPKSLAYDQFDRGQRRDRLFFIWFFLVRYFAPVAIVAIFLYKVLPADILAKLGVF